MFLPAHASAAAFPLRISENGRYLEDQRKEPFLWMGDCPWGLFLQNDAILKRYLDDRSRRGFTVLQAHLIPESGLESLSKGFEPFGIPGDLGTPNDRYFDRVAGVIRYAAGQGLLVQLNPIWIGGGDGGWREVVKTNGTAKCLDYGKYLGRKFKRLDNILWLHGGGVDPRPWMGELRSIAEGIRQSAPGHRLHAMQCGSSSAGRELLLAERWLTIHFTSVPRSETPGPAKGPFGTLFHAKAAYSIDPAVPFVMGLEEVDGGGGTTPRRQRQDAWWSVLSGAAGYDTSHPSIRWFAEGWEKAMDEPVLHFAPPLTRLLASFRWQRLVPDFNRAWMPPESGALEKKSSPAELDGLAMAADSDGAMLLAYVPEPRGVRIDLSKFRLPVLARWFDPVNGKFSPAVEGLAEMPNTGVHEFAAPGKNSAGDFDWVLVLDARPNRQPLAK